MITRAQLVNNLREQDKKLESIVNKTSPTATVRELRLALTERQDAEEALADFDVRQAIDRTLNSETPNQSNVIEIIKDLINAIADAQSEIEGLQDKLCDIETELNSLDDIFSQTLKRLK